MMFHALSKALPSNIVLDTHTRVGFHGVPNYQNCWKLLWKPSLSPRRLWHFKIQLVRIVFFYLSSIWIASSDCVSYIVGTLELRWTIRSTKHKVHHVPNDKWQCQVSNANDHIVIERKQFKGTQELSLFFITSPGASIKTLMGRPSYPGLTFDTKMLHKSTRLKNRRFMKFACEQAQT